MTDQTPTGNTRLAAALEAWAQAADMAPRPNTIIVRNDMMLEAVERATGITANRDYDGDVPQTVTFNHPAVNTRTGIERAVLTAQEPTIETILPEPGRVNVDEYRRYVEATLGDAMEVVIGQEDNEQTRMNMRNLLAAVGERLTENAPAGVAVQVGDPNFNNVVEGIPTPRGPTYYNTVHGSTSSMNFKEHPVKEKIKKEDPRLGMALDKAFKSHSEMDFQGCYEAVQMFMEIFSNRKNVSYRQEGKLPNFVHINKVTEMVHNCMDSFAFLNEAIDILAMDIYDHRFDRPDSENDLLERSREEYRRGLVTEKIMTSRNRIRWTAAMEVGSLSTRGERLSDEVDQDAVFDVFEDPDEDISNLSEMDRLAIEIADMRRAQERREREGYGDQLEEAGQAIAGVAPPQLRGFTADRVVAEQRWQTTTHTGVAFNEVPEDETLEMEDDEEEQERVTPTEHTAVRHLEAATRMNQTVGTMEEALRNLRVNTANRRQAQFRPANPDDEIAF